MTNSKLHPKFFSWWLKQKIDSETGFSLTEVLVAILVLTIAFTINLQFLISLKIKNIEQEIETAAVSLSKRIMDDIRYSLRRDLNNYPQPFNQLTGINSSGDTPVDTTEYTFNADIYVCTNEPTIAPDQTVSNCNTGGTSDIRYVVVQIIDGGRSNETLYTVESVFTQLQ